jgi:hypothetical protein
MDIARTRRAITMNNIIIIICMINTVPFAEDDVLVLAPSYNGKHIEYRVNNAEKRTP